MYERSVTNSRNSIEQSPPWEVNSRSSSQEHPLPPPPFWTRDPSQC
jgi:hypothetical protein